MNLGDFFVEEILLWIVSIIFLVAAVSRMVFFLIRTVRSGNAQKLGPTYVLSTLGQVLLPFHRAVRKKPVYAALRYLFHILFFATPIWLGGHIVLWSESRFGWEWTPLPDLWADWMTLVVIGIVVYFLLRRVFLPKERMLSDVMDYIIILLSGLPFVSGYLLAHGNLSSIAFFGNNMRLIHVLSGEAIILGAAFLFYRSRLDTEKCTGCASCRMSCPTGTLEVKEEGRYRIFTYSHYQCICCGSCVNTCPETAALLRHDLSFRRFFQIVPRMEIHRAELEPCAKCGALFVPKPLFSKIDRLFKEDYLRFCPDCRITSLTEVIPRISRPNEAMNIENPIASVGG